MLKSIVYTQDIGRKVESRCRVEQKMINLSRADVINVYKRLLCLEKNNVYKRLLFLQRLLTIINVDQENSKSVMTKT